MPLLRCVFAALFLVLSAVRPAAAVEWTDIWWNPSEGGWGVNLVQSDKTMFATFFVYGVDRQPTWYAGIMQLGENGVWSGGLHRTVGSYLGAPWDASQHENVVAGSVSFTPSSATTGTLTYSVGSSVTVTKTITRQTLTVIPLGGGYSGAIYSIFSNCNNTSLNGPFRAFVDLNVVQTETSLQLTFPNYNQQNSSTTCVMQGASAQNGPLFSIQNATYVCGGATAANNVQVSEIRATSQGIEGQWTTSAGAFGVAGCVETAYFSAVLR
jgi:hypothetical protein